MLSISGVRKITILSHGKCIFPQTLSFRYAVSRIYVILRVAPPPEGSGPDSEGLKTRSFTSFRTTEQGPSRCSGRQSTRARYRDYVILRSGFATKNLTLPSICHPEGCSIARRIWGGSEDLRTRSFTSFRTTEQGPSRCSGRQSTPGRCYDSVILRSGFCDEESDLAFNMSS